MGGQTVQGRVSDCGERKMADWLRLSEDPGPFNWEAALGSRGEGTSLSAPQSPLARCDPREF